jgi:hypothetical protein
MTIDQEKKLLIEGIQSLRQQMVVTRGAACLELMGRLESLRCCLEALIAGEISATDKRLRRRV